MTRSVMTRMPRRVRRVQQGDEVIDGAELGQHLVEVADVVATVAQRRVVERWQPKAVDAKPLQVVQLFGQAPQVAGAVGVGVIERAHQHLVEHRALEPRAIVRQRAGVPEVLRGGVLDAPPSSTWLPSAGSCAQRTGADAMIHPTSNLPMSDENESPSTSR